MDGGIHDDQNFYSRRPPSRSPDRQQSQQQHQQYSHQPGPSTPEQHDASAYRSTSPETPPTLSFLTTANLQAVTSNGFESGLSAGIDPDDFYREYRGPPQLSNGYSDPAADEMPSKTSSPRHPTVSVARNSLKPPLRSVSEPVSESVNDRVALGNSKAPAALNGVSQYGKPSVKDLLKRFDSNSDAPPVINRKPAPPRVVAKGPPGSGPSYARDRAGSQARSNTSSQTNSPSRPDVSTTTSPSATSRSSQRAQRQDANSSPSTTTRSPPPKNAAPGTAKQASKSMTNLSPTSSKPPPVPATRKPLFGEITPIQTQPEVGYGIPQTPRRTSDPHLRPSPTSLEHRPTLDASPSSPTAWYLGVSPSLENADPNKPGDTPTSPSRSRSHSNPADIPIKLDTSIGAVPNHTSTTSHIAQMHEVAKTASRLPISTKRLSSQSGSSSPTSPVSNSARQTKTHVIARRMTDQNSWNTASAGRSTTPTSRATISDTRTTPPRQAPRRSKVPEKLNTNPSSLKAYISAAPPKQSPPLRSSRPRQPVSSASTTTVRRGSTDASGSPQRIQSGVKGTRGGEANERRPRRNVQPTPADFAAHRERIQRAYTKSIHENEQREIRAANLRRLNERYTRLEAERAVQRQAEQAELAAARAAAEAVETAAREAQTESSERDAAPSEVPPRTGSVPAPSPSPQKPLQITTSFLLPDEDGSPGHEQDSPTLGMPGRFLDDEEPASAVTDATATTEFDNEQQTEPPQLSSSSFPAAESSDGMTSSSIFQWSDLSVEQATYGIRHSLSMTPNSADASDHSSPIDEYQPDHTPTKDLFNKEMSLPGAFKHDSGEYNPHSFASRIASTSPMRTPPPPQSITATPLKSVSQVGDSVHDDGQLPGTSQIHPPPRILLHPEPDSMESNNIPGMKDAVHYLRTPSTDLNYESSGSYGGPNTSGSDSFEVSYEQLQNVDNAPGNHISSQRSSWTNDSIGTTESSGHVEYITSVPVTEREESEQHRLQTSQQPFVEPPRRASPSNREDPTLPADEAFDIAFSDPTPVSLWPSYPPPDPPLQEHEPSDPPTRSPPSVSTKRPASGFYQSGHSDTARNTESPRASEDVASARASLYTPRSSTQISLEGSTANQSFESKDILIEATVLVEATEEDKKVAEKLKKRLFQRRMLIKELIDTESVYLKDMNVVEEIYKGTAEACPKLDANDVKIIFRNTDEIVAFSTMFLDELKSAGASVYSQRSQRKSKAPPTTSTTTSPSPEDRFSIAATLTEESDDQKDRRTFVGANFGKHLKKMQAIYTDFLKSSEQASAKLSSLQADGAVKVWLSECNLVAKDLTAAWDIDALLVKPVQRITRYQLLLAQIFEHTSEDHPDWPALRVTVDELASLLKNIDDLKKRIQMVGKIVGRKRKESDVRTGIAKAFGRRTEKVQGANAARVQDDEVYRKLHDKFGDDYLRLQVVLRDVEYYTRETTTYVRKFLEHLSSIELLMRIGASPYPELESKWVRFNISMRDMGSVALEDHLNSVRLKVIEPFEQVILAYGPPGLAMKKRNKRRLDYEKYMSLKGQGKKIDEKLQELVDQYEALNETLKHELPKLSAMTESIGNVCLIQFVNIQTLWYGIWQEKVRTVLEDSQVPKDIADIVSMFTRDFKYAEARANELGIVNGTFLTATPKPRTSQSTQSTHDTKGRPSNLSTRSRTLSFNSDKSPSLPTPDFEKSRHSGNFTFSPIVVSSPGLSHFGQQSSSHSTGHSRNGSLTPGTPDPMSAFGNRSNTANTVRPNTSRSMTSDTGTTRPSNDYSTQYRRESGSTSNSGYRHVDGPPQSTRPFSGIFHSAMPLPDGPEDSARSSRASSRDRNVSGGYNILYLAASLFEFNISATKSEAGYPYLTYQAGEIFDVIGEKGELWLAKNQDDMTNQVGWIWSKHFARLAAD